MDDGRFTGRLRRVTWPLGGFLFGLLLSTPQPHAAVTLLIGTTLGLLFAFLAFLIALLKTRRGPTKTYTKTYIPLSGGRPELDAAFVVTFLAAMGVKLAGYWGLFPLALGMIPIAIVIYGRSDLSTEEIERMSEERLGETDERQVMTREEMIAGLRAMADDSSTDLDQRERALDRLRAFERISDRENRD